MSDTKATEYILLAYAKGTPGILLRISGLFGRRCYNIINIVAVQMEGGQHSEMIIVVQDDSRIVRQVDRQLDRLEGIEQVTVLERNNTVVCRRLLLRIHRIPESSEFLVTLANALHASILRVSPTTTTLELVGDAMVLNSLIELCKSYQIEQILHTGTVAMSTQGVEAC